MEGQTEIAMTIQREFIDPSHRAAYVAGLRTGTEIVNKLRGFSASELRLEFGELTAAEIRTIRAIAGFLVRSSAAVADKVENGNG
jgi:hypothetical protein